MSMFANKEAGILEKTEYRRIPPYIDAPLHDPPHFERQKWGGKYCNK
jgi:hypothetical protein